MTRLLRLALPALLAAACFSAPASAQPGTAAPFAGLWRSALPNDLGTEIRTERDQLGVVIRFARPNATCVQGAAGRVTAPGVATLEARRTTCTDGFVQQGGPACTLRLAPRQRLVVSCAHNGWRNVMRRVR
jgi:hypothetical protein